MAYFISAGTAEIPSERDMTMGPGTSSRSRNGGQGPSDETFKRLIEAETLLKMGPAADPDMEQPMTLSVRDWRTTTPSIELLVDERPADTDFAAWLHTRQLSLEFMFKIPAGYPGRRSRFRHYITKLMFDEDVLGITSIYYWPSGMQKCMDTLNRARKRRPKWSEPMTLYGAQFFWMKRSPTSPIVYIKIVVDDDETCILGVNESDPEYKNEAGADPVRLDHFLFLTCAPFMPGPLANN